MLCRNNGELRPVSKSQLERDGNEVRRGKYKRTLYVMPTAEPPEFLATSRLGRLH